MPQEEFAGRVGISQNYLSTIEPGKVEIGAEILIRISREFANSIEGRLTDSGSVNMARQTSIGDAYRNRRIGAHDLTSFWVKIIKFADPEAFFYHFSELVSRALGLRNSTAFCAISSTRFREDGANVGMV